MKIVAKILKFVGANPSGTCNDQQIAVRLWC